MKPTPRELRVLVAVSGGCSLSAAGKRLGMPRTSVAAILSGVYLRLGTAVTGRGSERRAQAVDICKRHGWWPDDAETMRPSGEIN